MWARLYVCLWDCCVVARERSARGPMFEVYLLLLLFLTQAEAGCSVCRNAYEDRALCAALVCDSNHITGWATLFLTALGSQLLSYCEQQRMAGYFLLLKILFPFLFVCLVQCNILHAWLVWGCVLGTIGISRLPSFLLLWQKLENEI